MTPPDFDELARLWTEEHSAEEERDFQLLVRRVGRRAKALQYAELGMGGLLILAVLVAFFVNAAPATLIVGGLIVVAILWVGWKPRQEDVAQLVHNRSREAMLEAALHRGRTSLRHSALGLLLLLPGFLLGALLKYSVQNAGEIDGFLSALAASVSRVGGGMAGVILLLVAFAYLWRSHLAMRHQVGRLERLRAEYREEARLDDRG